MTQRCGHNSYITGYFIIKPKKQLKITKILINLCGLIVRNAVKLLKFKNTPKIFCYKLNVDLINVMKKNSRNVTKTAVSLNDVVVSWFFREISQTGTVHEAVNMREKITDLNNDMAGGYTTSIRVDTNCGMMTSEDHRIILENCLSKDGMITERSLQELMQDSGSLVFNWRNCHQTVQIPGYREIFQMPVLEPGVLVHNLV